MRRRSRRGQGIRRQAQARPRVSTPAAQRHPCSTLFSFWAPSSQVNSRQNRRGVTSRLANAPQMPLLSGAWDGPSSERASDNAWSKHKIRSRGLPQLRITNLRMSAQARLAVTHLLRANHMGASAGRDVSRCVPAHARARRKAHTLNNKTTYALTQRFQSTKVMHRAAEEAMGDFLSSRSRRPQYEKTPCFEHFFGEPAECFLRHNPRDAGGAGWVRFPVRQVKQLVRKSDASLCDKYVFQRKPVWSRAYHGTTVESIFGLMVEGVRDSKTDEPGCNTIMSGAYRFGERSLSKTDYYSPRVILLGDGMASNIWVKRSVKLRFPQTLKTYEKLGQIPGFQTPVRNLIGDLKFMFRSGGLSSLM
jgi:hypothetical protein